LRPSFVPAGEEFSGRRRRPELLGIESRLPALTIRTGLFIADADGRNEKPVCRESLDTTLHFPLTVGGSFSHSERAGWRIFTGFTGWHGWSGWTSDRLTKTKLSLCQTARLLPLSPRAEADGDIWLLDLATHKYGNLTNHRPIFVRVVADGKWIAFTSTVTRIPAGYLC